MKVQFHSPDEFLGEVQGFAQHIEGGITRVTREFRRSSSLPLTRVYVVATAVVSKPAEDGRPAGRWLLRLDHYCGDVMGYGVPTDPVSTAVHDKSVQALNRIEDQCRALGLIPRPGVFQEEGKA